MDLGGGAAGLLIPPVESRAFVAVSGGGKVAVIDLHTFAISGQIVPMGQPDGLAWVHRPEARTCSKRPARNLDSVQAVIA
jgi:hypothetical protein